MDEETKERITVVRSRFNNVQIEDDKLGVKSGIKNIVEMVLTYIETGSSLPQRH